MEKPRLSSGQVFVLRQSFPSAVLQSRQRAGLRSWSSVCSPQRTSHGLDRAEQWRVCLLPVQSSQFTTWSLKGVVGTLGTYRSRVSGQHESYPVQILGTNLTENACRSPTLLIKANAVRSTVFNNSNLSSTYCRGSKSSSFKAIRTEGRYQEGYRWGPVDLTSSPLWGNWWPSSASPQTYRLLHRDVRQQHLRVEGDSLRSNQTCRKESTTLIGHLRWSACSRLRLVGGVLLGPRWSGGGCSRRRGWRQQRAAGLGFVVWSPPSASVRQRTGPGSPPHRRSCLPGDRGVGACRITSYLPGSAIGAAPGQPEWTSSDRGTASWHSFPEAQGPLECAAPESKWVRTALVKLLQCLGLVGWQEGHGMQGRGGLSNSSVSFSRLKRTITHKPGQEVWITPPGDSAPRAKLHRNSALDWGGSPHTP